MKRVILTASDWLIRDFIHRVARVDSLTVITSGDLCQTIQN